MNIKIVNMANRPDPMPATELKVFFADSGSCNWKSFTYAMVDTGSTKTIISLKTLKALGISFNLGSERTLSTIGSVSSTLRSARIDILVPPVSGTEAVAFVNHEILVDESSDMDVLGLDILKFFELIYKDGKIVTFISRL